MINNASTCMIKNKLAKKISRKIAYQMFKVFPKTFTGMVISMDIKLVLPIIIINN